MTQPTPQNSPPEVPDIKADAPVFHQQAAQTLHTALRNAMRSIPELGAAAVVFHWNGIPDDPGIPFFILVDRGDGPNNDPVASGNWLAVQGLHKRLLALAANFTRIEANMLAEVSKHLGMAEAAIQKLQADKAQLQEEVAELAKADHGKEPRPTD